MTLEAAVSVPGKAILMGEHAAVYGHPAILAALSLRMTAAVRPGAGTAVRVDLPALRWRGESSWSDLAALARERRRVWSEAFERGDGTGFEPVRTPHQLALLAAGEIACLAGGRPLPGVAIGIESAIPPGAGCGSSAALAVAVCAALGRALDVPLDGARLRQAALAVERQQHGRPSGVDVEAVLRGGVLWCRRDLDGALVGDDISVDAAVLSGVRLFHSGPPSETTGDMVASVRRLERRDPPRVREALAEIERATHDARQALERGASEPLAAAVSAAERALERLGVVPEGVARAIRDVEESGAAAKISGAGGITGGAGLVLVVHPDPDARLRFAAPPGWTPIPAELAAPGMRSEVTA